MKKIRNGVENETRIEEVKKKKKGVYERNLEMKESGTWLENEKKKFMKENETWVQDENKKKEKWTR